MFNFKPKPRPETNRFPGNSYRLHFGPGPGFKKPSPEWLTVDVDPLRGDIVIDFNKFAQFPLDNESVEAIYGSHVFEHMSIFAAPKVFKDCYRILKPGGFIRIIIPNVRKSIEEYLKGNTDYPLFKKRANSLKEKLGYQNVAIFETLRGDFLSPNGQTHLLGKEGLAHQNAWDFESMVAELSRVGFRPENIKQVGYKLSSSPEFNFEGTYPSEADEEYRSLYIEAQK
jgi:predicted SAM-dependent methyltransferase